MRHNPEEPRHKIPHTLFRKRSRCNLLMSDRFTADKLAWLEQVQDDGELSATVFAVAFGIARHLNRETGDAWPSQATLGEMAGVSDRQVRKLLKILHTQGHLDIQTGGFHRPDRYRPILKDRNSSSSHDRNHSSALTPQDRNSSSRETGTPVPPNPLRELFERSAALSRDEESEADRIFAMMPKGSASRSNKSKIREAVASIVSEGTPALSLRIAVGAFVAASPDAKDQDGRFMGAAHTWLTEKRGWEAYLPSADDLFLRSRPPAEVQWFHRVRSWQHSPGYWRMKQDDFGPEPDSPNTRVPQAVLAYCLENTPPQPRPANDTHRLNQKRIRWQ